MTTLAKILTISLILLTSVYSYGQVQLEPVCAETVEVYVVDGYSNSNFVWSVEGGEVRVEDVGNDTVHIEWGYTPGNYTIEVQEFNSDGCSFVPSIAKIEVRTPYVNLGDDFTEICLGDTIVFDAGNYHEQPYEIQWMDNSNLQYYSSYKAEVISVRVIDGFGCIRYDTVSLFVNPLPTIDLGKDTMLCDIQNPYIIDPGDFATYLWSSSIGDFTTPTYPAYPVTTIPDTLTLDIIDNNGCVASDTMLILPCDIASMFTDMSNAFTPNGDNDNETWSVPYMEFFPNAILEIFDRWGRLVYRTTNVKDNPWDGKSKGREMPMDAYYFVLNLNYMNAEPIVGTVNLIR